MHACGVLYAENNGTTHKWPIFHHVKTHICVKHFPLFLLLSLAPQPILGLGLLHKIRLNFVEASQQFSFLQGRIVSPTPNPHPGGPGLCIYIPQRQGGPVIPLGTGCPFYTLVK
jgi:hypothetical protein